MTRESFEQNWKLKAIVRKKVCGASPKRYVVADKYVDGAFEGESVVVRENMPARWLK